MSDLAWFFRSPRSAPIKGDTFSQLYLLRRDIDTCFGTDPNTGAIMHPVEKDSGVSINCKAIWPGAMAILAGIDLLGKFFVGTDRTCGPGSVTVGARFKKFIKRYLGLSDVDADLVYQLRNSLLHSFGLYSEKIDNQGNVKVTYNFLLSQGTGTVVRHVKDDFYRIDVQCLRELFEKGVAQYENELRDTLHADHQELNDKFDAMFPKHAKPMSVFNV